MKNIKKNLKNIVPIWHLQQVVQVEITLKIMPVNTGNRIEF